MIKIIFSLLFSICLSNSYGQTIYQKDFDYYLKTIQGNYAYFDQQKTNWEKVKPIYQPQVDTCTSRNSFIQILEKILNELYNGHNFLNTNTDESNRLIPSGSDLKVVFKDDIFVIDEVREGFNSDLCGLKKGMQIISFNSISIKEGIKQFLPLSTSNYDNAIFEYAANMLLAGTHNEKRVITARLNEVTKDYFPDNVPNKTEKSYESVLDWKKLKNNVGYIKINNSLGDDALIKEFDIALDTLFNTDGLILDLRETPGGGTSTIARAIMGRFVDKELPYQKHLYIAEERETGIKRTTLEFVSPRQNVYRKRLIVLAGNWTGSMSEGIAIGFDAMQRATIAGTKMAGLLGEIFTFETPELKIPFSFPCVKLQTVKGLPREDFLPPVLAQQQSESVENAIKILSKKKTTNR
ncbi:MAG: peptidase [Saprospiraceae bacterium]|nr:peptidase [Saprospiraceae bacterium]